MAALIQQEQDGKKDEKDDSDEYSGSAKSEHERRDVFDSDFDEDEKDESESAEEEGSGFDDAQKEAKRLPGIAFRWIQPEEREKEEGKERIECKKSQPVSGKRRRRAAAENFETPIMATDAPPPKRPKPDGSHVDTCGACRLRLGAPVEAGPWARDMTILACARCPRAFHARCLGIVDMACAAPTKLPWIDPQGHWLCGACEGEDEGERHALDLVSAAALASMRRVAPVEGASPRRKATAARKGALEVVDALLGHSHDFGRYFRELRAVREALDVDDAPAPTQRAARVEKPRKPPRKPGKTLFPTKLYEIVSRHSDIVRWDRDERHLVIEDDIRLVEEIMPVFFNGTGNYTSFARQLNYYGFNRLDAAKRQGDEPLVFFNKNSSVKEVSDLEKLVRWIAPDKDAESSAGGGGGDDDADIDVDDASDAWAAASWARTTIAIKRVRTTLQFEDEGQDAYSRMAKELSALAEVGFARMVRPHLPQPVVEDLYQR